MAVAAGDRIRVYELMAGETGPLDFPFPLPAAADLAVWRRRTGSDDSRLSLATHYTVTIAGDHASATVTLLAEALAGDLVALVGDITEARSTSFTGFGAGALKSGPLNSELDRLTIMVQELRRDADRSLRLSPFDANEAVTLPADTDAGTIINDLLGAASGATTDAAAAAASATAASASQSAAASSASSASSSSSGAAASAASASASETNASASATAAQNAQALTEASAAGGSANLYRQWPSEAFPALSPWAFTSTPAGTPTSGAVLGSGAANNGAWRVTNSAQYVCMRDWVRVDAGVPLSIQAVVQRIVDSTSNIEVGCICMNASGTELTPRVLITSNPAVADGRTTLSFTIADVLTSHDGVAATWPSGTVYIRPYVQTLGTSHTTDIISISAPATPPVNVSTTQTTGVLIVDPVGFVMQELLPPATASASSAALWSDGHTLWGLNSGFARLLDSQAISVKLALVGDSWTERRIIPQAIADRVYALYGQGADGWLQPAITSGNNINSVAKPTFANFTTYDVKDVTPSLPYGPDGFRVDCATTAGTIGWTGIRAATIYIYYRDTTGTFRYRTDGGAWTTVTGGGTNATAKATISGLSTGSTHSLDIDTTGNTGTVQIFGAYATGMTGVEISHIANSGTTSADIEGVCNTTTAQYILADIAPVAAQINLGTNDCVAAISGTAYEASLRNIIAAYASHNTQMGTVLVAPPRNNRGGTIAMEDYAAACMRIAASISCEYIDFTRVWSAWANENGAGMWTDTTHLNSAGAQRMGRRIVGKFYDLGN